MGGVSAELGISIEPIDQVMAQIQSSDTAIASSKATTMANAEKITTKVIENLYNYCSSFSSSLLTNAQGEQFFPLKVNLSISFSKEKKKYCIIYYNNY